MGTELREPLEYGYVGDILKWEPHESGDGTIYVYGVAADPTLDLDGQVCDPAWLKSAMPDWFKSANVREQHSSIAAGRGVSLTEGDGDRWLLKSHVVDAGTVTKVKNKVLNGYSIGVRRGEVLRGKSVGAPNGRIVGGKIVEVSLVDRPCNPNATIEIAKALSVDDEWTELEPVDGMIVKGAAATEAAEEGEQYSQAVDDAVDAEAEGDSDPLGLFDLDELGDEPGGQADGEDIEKGLIDSLLHGPKDAKHKRDPHGKFARTGTSVSRAAARRAERARRVKERQDAHAHRERMDAEAAGDALHAQRQGRSMEAGEHRARLGHYDKSAEADGAGLELTSGLEYREAREAMRMVDDILSGRIDKAARKVYDEHDDIEGCREVIAQIAELMISELEELATGRYDEFQDLSILMRAMEAMRSFHQRERAQAGLPWDDDDDMVRRDFERIEMSVSVDGDASRGDILKRDFSADARRKAADSGAAMPDGSFPIKNAEDLSNAVHLAGNAKDPAAARAHIKRRAEALGLTGSLPESWAEGGDVSKALDVSSDDLATLVRAEITKATGTLTETIEAQNGELAKLRAQVAEWGSKPIPSGVMINKSVMPSAPARAETTAADAQTPEFWDAKAAAPGIDPGVAAAYRDKARELRKG